MKDLGFLKRLRSRRFAALATVAMVAGVGTAVAVEASSGVSTDFYQMDAPCKIVDTRSGLGGKTGKLASGEEFKFITGESTCWDEGGVDAQSPLVSMTAVDATSNGFLQVRETDPAPFGTFMNYTNAFNATNSGLLTTLWANQSFDILNFGGSTHIVVYLNGHFFDGS